MRKMVTFYRSEQCSFFHQQSVHCYTRIRRTSCNSVLYLLIQISEILLFVTQKINIHLYNYMVSNKVLYVLTSFNLIVPSPRFYTRKCEKLFLNYLQRYILLNSLLILFVWFYAAFNNGQIHSDRVCQNYVWQIDNI